MNLSDDDVAFFTALMSKTLQAYDLLDTLPDEVPAVKYPRTPGFRPSPEENTHNAWYYRTSIRGAKAGKLFGKRIAIKDNILVAGVPLMNGASSLEGYVPDFDATVVTRVLDEGAEIIGKAHSEGLCLSGYSATNPTGVIRNAYKSTHSAGGSSSGCGVVVALGEADMAIGCDQAGSIRMPAAANGLCGLKPTWGLVPYTGILPMEVTVDHVGPMTKTVADNALLLEVLAGDDGDDPRIKAAKSEQYTDALGRGIEGMRIAILDEGFHHPHSDRRVNACVLQAAKRLEGLGASVSNVSIPLHLTAHAIGRPIVANGVSQTMMFGDGFGHGRQDVYALSLMSFHRGWRQQADTLPDTAKLILLTGTYVHNMFGSRHYAKAINVSRRVRAAYDRVLEQHDLLLMPTTPCLPAELPTQDTTRMDFILRSSVMLSNTSPFNVTHHPAISIPCGMIDGLPVGLMLVGRHFHEKEIYRAAHTFEQSCDWTSVSAE